MLPSNRVNNGICDKCSGDGKRQKIVYFVIYEGHVAPVNEKGKILSERMWVDLVKQVMLFYEFVPSKRRAVRDIEVKQRKDWVNAPRLQDGYIYLIHSGS